MHGNILFCSKFIDGTLYNSSCNVNRSIKVYCPILSTLRWSFVLGHVVMTSKDAIWLELGPPIHQVHVCTFEVMSCVHIDVVKVMRRVLLRTDGSEIFTYLDIHTICNEWGHPEFRLFIVIVLFIIVHVGYIAILVLFGPDIH